jgi:hypothetical protein
MPANFEHILQWLLTTSHGMLALSALAGILAIGFITFMGAFLKTLIRPNVEHTFYNTILKHWFKGYFLKHKIVATFIRANNLGEDIVNGIIHLIGMFIAVAFVSSALTATILHLQLNAFIYSPYLLFLMSANIMLAWSVGKNMLYFRKVVYRLK